MSPRVALAYCSERESELIASRLASTDFTTAPLGLTPIADSAFDIVVIGSEVMSRPAVFAALRERLHAMPAAIFLRSPEVAAEFEDEDLAIFIEGDLPRLPHF